MPSKFHRALSNRTLFVAITMLGTYSLLFSQTAYAEGVEFKKGGMDNVRKAVGGYSILGGGGKVNENTTARTTRGTGSSTGTTGSSAGNTGSSAGNKHATTGGASGQFSHSAKYAKDAKTLYEQAMAAEGKQSLDETIALLQKSLNIRLAYFGATDRAIPKIQEQIGDLLTKQNKNREAISAFSTSLVSYAKLYGPGCDERIGPLISIGKLYLKRQDFNNAYNSLNQAYLLQARSKGAGSPETMQTRLLVAQSAQGLKDWQSAYDRYREALSYEGENDKLLSHEQLVKTLEDYLVVLKNLKKDDEADKVQQRLTELKNGKPEKQASHTGTEANSKPAAENNPAPH